MHMLIFFIFSLPVPDCGLENTQNCLDVLSLSNTDRCLYHETFVFGVGNTEKLAIVAIGKIS